MHVYITPHIQAILEVRNMHTPHAPETHSLYFSFIVSILILPVHQHTTNQLSVSTILLWPSNISSVLQVVTWIIPQVDQSCR